jgi:hypothetical protein
MDLYNKNILYYYTIINNKIDSKSTLFYLIIHQNASEKGHFSNNKK